MNHSFFWQTKALAIGYGQTPLRHHAGGPGQNPGPHRPQRRGQVHPCSRRWPDSWPRRGHGAAGRHRPAGYFSRARPGPANGPHGAPHPPHRAHHLLRALRRRAATPTPGGWASLSQDRGPGPRRLALVGARALADRDVNKISDGQRQRVLLARAICQQPELILLDEPTSFLDIKGKAELLGILTRLAREQHLPSSSASMSWSWRKNFDEVVCVPGAASRRPHPQRSLLQREPLPYLRSPVKSSMHFSAPRRARSTKPPASTEKPKFEHYIRSGRSCCAGLHHRHLRRPRRGGRSPVCCSPAARPRSVALRTPKGASWWRWLPLFCRLTENGAVCTIEKNGGDDADVTTGLPVIGCGHPAPG